MKLILKNLHVELIRISIIYNYKGHNGSRNAIYHEQNNNLWTYIKVHK